MKIEKTHPLSHYFKSIQLLLLSSYLIFPLIMGSAYTDFVCLLNTVIIIAIYLYLNRYYNLTKDDLERINSHTKISFTHTDMLPILIKKNIKTIGVFLLYFVLACFENDVLPFALISFCMLMVVLIFTNRQRLILTEEQIFLIYRNGHQQMNIKEVLRISGSKNKMTFIDLENQLHVDMRGWEKQEVERLRTYVEQVLSISIPKNQ